MPPRKLAVSLALLVFALGCATPVGIRRVSLSEVDRILGENAVTGDAPSALSHQVLARLGLSTLYEDDPRKALEQLRAGLGGPDEHERLLALAELWYATARQSADRGEYLAAAVCAYAYVFPATPPCAIDTGDPELGVDARLGRRRAVLAGPS